MVDMNEKEVQLLLEELEFTKKGIENTINENGYIRFPNDFTVFEYGKNGELNNEFLCYTPNLPSILKNKKEDIAIVSGIGATNAPTMGTMSEILKILDAQKKTGIYTYFIINDFGSINARSMSVKRILLLTERYKKFIRKLGFDEKAGRICLHNNIDHARTFSLISRMIKLQDFSNNTEATDTTYDRLKLRGSDFSVLLDHVYTATDVLLPIIKDRKKGIVVICGLDEFYHANIGGIALERMKEDPDLKSLIPENVGVGAIYSRIVSGLHPYFKQSKSIPDSSINLGQSEETISKLILQTSEINEIVILEMIQLASGWPIEAIKKAEKAFKKRQTSSAEWVESKKKYLETVLSMKRVWDSSKFEDSDIHDLIFKDSNDE